MSRTYGSTTVPVERSQGQIRELLASHGAREFGFGEAIDDDGRPWAAVTFTHGQVRVRLRVPLKLPEPGEIRRKVQRARTRTEDEIRFDVMEQEAKRIWRVMAHNLKARMVSVDEGVETFEEAFLAHIVDLTTGLTIYEQLAEHGAVQLGAPLLQLEAPSGREKQEARDGSAG